MSLPVLSSQWGAVQCASATLVRAASAMRALGAARGLQAAFLKFLSRSIHILDSRSPDNLEAVDGCVLERMRLSFSVAPDNIQLRVSGRASVQRFLDDFLKRGLGQDAVSVELSAGGGPGVSSPGWAACADSA